MSEAQIIPARQRLPDDFWQAVMAAPWRYDLFQLRRLDAQGGQRYPLGRAAAEIRSAAHWSETIAGVCPGNAGQRSRAQTRATTWRYTALACSAPTVRCQPT